MTHFPNARDFRLCRNEAGRTRADDERLLHWLQLRTAGVTTPEIGAMYGTTSATIRVATNRIRADDKEPGAGGYWGAV